MEGGAGNDRYIVDAAADVGVEAAGGGTDTVEAAVNYVLADNFEILVLTGSALTGTGNAASNAIEGNARNNRLIGDAGNDKLVGLGGKDRLDAGDGDDHLQGGSGSDVLDGGAGNDRLFGGAARDLLTGGTGEDRFAFLSDAEAGIGKQCDVIRDFVHGIDLIDFKQIDAQTGRGGNQRFEFIEDDAFSGRGRRAALLQGLRLRRYRWRPRRRLSNPDRERQRARPAGFRFLVIDRAPLSAPRGRRW